jgi:hypothetical protein
VRKDIDSCFLGGADSLRSSSFFTLKGRDAERKVRKKESEEGGRLGRMEERKDIDSCFLGETDSLRSKF